MNTAVVLLLLVAAASAQDFIPVLERKEVHDASGQYNLEYKTGDGITVSETGRLIPNFEGDGEVLVKEGKISYTSPEGIPIFLSYFADTTGFHPVGAHLPESVVA